MFSHMKTILENRKNGVRIKRENIVRMYTDYKNTEIILTYYENVWIGSD